MLETTGVTLREEHGLTQLYQSRKAIQGGWSFRSLLEVHQQGDL